MDLVHEKMIRITHMTMLTVQINEVQVKKAYNNLMIVWPELHPVASVMTPGLTILTSKTPSMFLQRMWKKNGWVDFGDTVFKTWAVLFSTTSHHVAAMEQYGIDISGIYTHLLCVVRAIR